MPDKLWRLRPDEYEALSRAAKILRKHQGRHSGAKRSADFVDELIRVQGEVDVNCVPRR